MSEGGSLNRSGHRERKRGVSPVSVSIDRENHIDSGCIGGKFLNFEIAVRELIQRCLLHERTKRLRLLVAVLAVTAAMLVRWIVESSIDLPFPFVTFSFAVVVSTWYGGFRYGLIALGLSLVFINYLFSDSEGFGFVLPDTRMGVEIIIYLLLGLLSAWLVESLQRSRQAAETAARIATEEANQRRIVEEILRKTQQDLKEYASGLEQKVQERTQALEQSVRFLESFLYSMTHEIRAPVRAMQGFTYALKEDYVGKLDETGTDYCNRIFNAATRLDSLILDLLNYGRIGHLDLPLMTVDLEYLLQHAIDELNIRQFVQPEPLPEVLANPVVARIALTNLLSNAIKFIPRERTPVIRIKSKGRGDHVRIFVFDNGIGIEARYFNKIFMPFQRLHIHDSLSGNGIGLPLVKLAMERVGGAVGIMSVVGKGSCFWLEFQTVKKTRFEKLRPKEMADA